jgi:hypothetical protein
MDTAAKTLFLFRNRDNDTNKMMRRIYLLKGWKYQGDGDNYIIRRFEMCSVIKNGYH